MATRRRSVLPTGASSAPAPPSVTRRSAATVLPAAPVSKVIKKAAPTKSAPIKAVTAAPVRGKRVTKIADDFISGESFDFKMIESPKGVMTRARRSSIYTRPTAPMKETNVRQSVRKVRKATSTLDNLAEEEASPKLASPKQAKTEAPMKRPAAGQKTPLASINREIETAPPSTTRATRTGRRSVAPTPARSKKSATSELPKVGEKENGPELYVQLTALKMTPNKTNLAPKPNILGPRLDNIPIRPATILKDISLGLSNKVRTQGTFTPQAADPRKLLQKNLKIKVENKIDERVQTLPSGSPYTLMVGFTENGSPAEQLMKMKDRPTRSSAAQFVTATPAPTKRKRTFEDITPVHGPGRKRLNLSIVDNDGENVDPELATTPKPKANEKASPSSPVSPQSPKMAPTQLVTGDLGRMCVIM